MILHMSLLQIIVGFSRSYQSTHLSFVPKRTLAALTSTSRFSLRSSISARAVHTTMNNNDDTPPPWKKVHEQALLNGDRSYIDPATGYTAFTELSHKDRGYCCGNTCRHCPYNYENVGKPEQLKARAREARLKKIAAKKSAK